ncbi:glutathione metabolism protein [Arsukibacterium ikkense]|uniref:Glutathione metabolism protein n=1 Tax=Arsukibacterium ikkense TaxID=336831 RepID=A0A0M2V3W7_9GAMM|nr:MAPEG family protein [Arsukibacterium ikkense]KKO44335.1 glutathione metabolism protein [Arsukibacterium ikkense]
MITAFYAGLLAILFVVLSFRVIAKRNQFKVAIGSNGQVLLERAIRVHANFAEYVPFALLLLFLAEYSGLAPVYLHILGIALIIGRLSHAYGVSQQQEQLKFRVFGMMLSMLVILAAAVASIVLYALRTGWLL